jgi:hypothetical protein
MPGIPRRASRTPFVRDVVTWIVAFVRSLSELPGRCACWATGAQPASPIVLPGPTSHPSPRTGRGANRSRGWPLESTPTALIESQGRSTPLLFTAAPESPFGGSLRSPQPAHWPRPSRTGLFLMAGRKGSSRLECRVPPEILAFDIVERPMAESHLVSDLVVRQTHPRHLDGLRVDVNRVNPRASQPGCCDGQDPCPATPVADLAGARSLDDLPTREPEECGAERCDGRDSQRDHASCHSEGRVVSCRKAARSWRNAARQRPEAYPVLGSRPGSVNPARDTRPTVGGRRGRQRRSFPIAFRLRRPAPWPPWGPCSSPA